MHEFVLLEWINEKATKTQIWTTLTLCECVFFPIVYEEVPYVRLKP